MTRRGGGATISDHPHNRDRPKDKKMAVPYVHIWLLKAGGREIIDGQYMRCTNYVCICMAVTAICIWMFCTPLAAPQPSSMTVKIGGEGAAPRQPNGTLHHTACPPHPRIHTASHPRKQQFIRSLHPNRNRQNVHLLEAHLHKCLT